MEVLGRQCIVAGRAEVERTSGKGVWADISTTTMSIVICTGAPCMPLAGSVLCDATAAPSLGRTSQSGVVVLLPPSTDRIIENTFPIYIAAHLTSTANGLLSATVRPPIKYFCPESLFIRFHTTISKSTKNGPQFVVASAHQSERFLVFFLPC